MKRPGRCFDLSLKETSKFISLILRHNPETIGITLNEHGWANVINSGLAHAVHSGEIFDLTIGKNRQEMTYIKDTDEELLYWMNGDWETNLPELFSAIDNML